MRNDSRSRHEGGLLPQSEDEPRQQREGGARPQCEEVRLRSWVILWRTMRTVGAQRIFVGYLLFLLASGVVFCLVEPETFHDYGDALWYCFQTITTIGFGDEAPHTMPARALSVVIGLSALFVVALLTGITVSFFNERIRLRRNESFIEFEHGLEHLTELTPEQLARMEQQYRKFSRRAKR